MDSNFYSVLSRAENTVSSTTGASPRMIYIFVVAVILIVAYLLYIWLKPKAQEVTKMGPIVLKGDDGKPRPNSTEAVFTQGQIASSLGNNFTLSFFVYMDDVNRERIPIGGPKGDFRFKPFMYILGVGNILLDPIHQVARFRIQPLARTQATHIDVDNFMIARWNQLTITLEGRSVDIYLNGALATSAQLSNLPILNPVGVLIETSPDFSGQAGLIQAWPHRLTEKQVMENYKRNTDTRGKPLIPDVSVNFMDVFRGLGKQLCDLGFCGFRIEAGPLQYVDYEFA